MGDKPTGLCKSCNKEVTRVFSHIQKPSGNYIYRDDHGRLWKGNVCADCQADKRKLRYKSKRVAQASSSPEEVATSPTASPDSTQGDKS